jgi:hypothetical protein
LSTIALPFLWIVQLNKSISWKATVYFKDTSISFAQL